MELTGLLPEVLRAIICQLNWADALAARAACRALAAAVDPLVTALRVPLQLNGPCKQLAAALARLECVQNCTLLLLDTTTSDDLSNALQIVGSKANITSVTIKEVRTCRYNRPSTCAEGLELHHLVHVRRLTIQSTSWPLEHIWKQIAALATVTTGSSAAAAPAAISNSTRSADRFSCFTSSSSSSHGMATTTSSSSSSSSHPHSSPWTCRTVAGSTSGCALEALKIELHDSPMARLTCFVLPEQLPSTLTRLTTPLPGQFGRSGQVYQVVCPLNVSHRQYLQQLVVRLPHLQSLSLTGKCEAGPGMMARAIEGLHSLQELQFEPGDALAGGLLGFMHPNLEREPLARWLLTIGSGRLKKLDMLSQRSGQHFGAGPPCTVASACQLRWVASSPQLEHLAGVLTPSPQESVPACDGQLKILVGALMAGVRPSQLMLQQVAHVGAGLTSLSLHHQGGLLSSMRQQVSARTHNVGFVPRSQPLWDSPGPLASMTHLVQLSLVFVHQRASDTAPLVLPQPAAVWRELPALQRLRLQGVAMGKEAPWGLSLLGRNAQRLPLRLQDLPCSQLQELELGCYDVSLPAAAVLASAAAAVGSDSSSTHTMKTVAWDAEVAAAVAALRFDMQQAQHRVGSREGPAANVAGSRCSNGLACILSKLQVLTLCDCGFFVPLQHAGSSSSTSMAAAAAATAATPTTTPLSSLLAYLVAPKNGTSMLRALRLHSVELCTQDILFIGSPQLGQHLQELHVEMSTFCCWLAPKAPDSTLSAGAQLQPQQQQHCGQVQQQPQQQRQEDSSQLPAPGCFNRTFLVHALQAAVRANRTTLTHALEAALGGLQDLRRLYLDVQEQQDDGGKGRWPTVSLLTPCCQLGRLQELRLVVSTSRDMLLSLPSEECSCTSTQIDAPWAPHELGVAAVPACKGPWDQLSQLQHLRRLDITLAWGIIGNGDRMQAPVGSCSGCRKEVGHSCLQEWLATVAPQAMPGCSFDMQVELVSKLRP